MASRLGHFGRFLVVVLVELVDVEAGATLVHVHIIGAGLIIHRRLDLDSLSAVTLLSVQLASVHGFDVEDAARLSALLA